MLNGLVTWGTTSIFNRQDSRCSLLGNWTHSLKVIPGFELELRDLGVNKEVDWELLRNILKIVVAIVSVGALANGRRDANNATTSNFFDGLFLLTWDIFGRSLIANFRGFTRRNNNFHLVRLLRSHLRDAHQLLWFMLLFGWLHTHSLSNNRKLHLS